MAMPGKRWILQKQPLISASKASLRYPSLG